MTINRDAYIDSITGHRIDPLTKIDITQAVESGDDTALCQIEIAQLDVMLSEEPGNWYLSHSLKAAKNRLKTYQAKAARES